MARRPSPPARLLAPLLLLAGLATGLAAGSRAARAAAVQIPVGLQPRNVVAGDLDGDGRPDLVTSCADTALVIVRNLGGGAWDVPRRISTKGQFLARSVALLDINGDGKLDLAVANQSGQVVGLGVHWALGNGDGTFGAFSSKGNFAPWGIQVFDFNSDGKSDLLAAGTLSYAFVNNPTTTFQTVSTGASGFPNTFTAGDVSNNGKPDYCYANGNTIQARNGDGVGLFGSAYTIATLSGAVYGLAVADLDGDGVNDIVASDWTNGNVVPLWGVSGSTYTIGTAITVGTRPGPINLADLDGDGRKDIVVLNGGSNNLSIVRNLGGRTFAQHVDVLTGPMPPNLIDPTPAPCAIADFDGDGKPDIAVPVTNAHQIVVLTNHGDGTFDGVPAPLPYHFLYSNAAWGTPSNWGPSRTTPSASDVLLFDGQTVQQATGVPFDGIQQLRVEGAGTRAVLSATSPVSGQIMPSSGGATPGLVVGAGATLALAGPWGMIVELGSGATGRIDGKVELSGGGARLQAHDADALQFRAGAIARADSALGAAPFGTGSAGSAPNSVRFQAGSVYETARALDPFTLAAPASMVTFDPGSRMRLAARQAYTATPRTYPTLEGAVAGDTAIVLAPSGFTVDSMMVSTGVLDLRNTGDVHVHRDIVCVGSTPVFVFGPPSGTGKIVLDGSQMQFLVHNIVPNTFVSRPNGVLEVNNPAGINPYSSGLYYALQEFNGTIRFVHGLWGGTLNLGPTGKIENASQSTGWVSAGLSYTEPHVGFDFNYFFTKKFDVGSVNHYAPLTANVFGLDGSLFLRADATEEADPMLGSAQIDMAHRPALWHSLIAYDTSDPNSVKQHFVHMDLTLGYDPGSLLPGSDPSTFVVRGRRFWADNVSNTSGDGGWQPLSSVFPTSSGITVTGMLEGNPLASIDHYYFMAGTPATVQVVAGSAVAPEGGLGAAPARAAGAKPADPLPTNVMPFAVHLSQASLVPVTVDFATADGTAHAGTDYTATSGTLSFAPGDTVAHVYVTLAPPDGLPSRNRTFSLDLSNVTGGAVAPQPVATGTIVDVDDKTAPSVQVVSPNGGEVLRPGTVGTLRWNATDNVFVSSVELAISRDDGATWEKLAYSAPNTGSYDFDVTGPESSQMRFLVVARDDPGNAAAAMSAGTWTISSTLDAPQAPPTAFALTAAGPNPARGAVRLEYALPREAAVRLEVLDAQGRVVARLADGVAAAGRYAAAWDAGAGARIAPGLYFARFQAGGVTQQRRIVVLR